MSKTVIIKNIRPRVYSANGVTLVPGPNELSEKDAQKFLEHPHIQIKIERGFIEVGEGVKLPKANKSTAAADKKAANKKAEEEKAEAEAAAAAANADAAKSDEVDGDDEAGEGDALGEYGVEEPPYGVAGLSAADSIEKIKDIEDVDYLIAVAAKDDRKTVVAAAESRVLDLKEAA